MVGQADHSVFRRLGPGAGCRGDRNEGQGGFGYGQAPADHLQMVHRHAPRGDQPGQGLGQIHCRPTAQAQNPIGRMRPRKRQRFFQHGQAWFGSACDRGNAVLPHAKIGQKPR